MQNPLDKLTKTELIQLVLEQDERHEKVRTELIQVYEKTQAEYEKTQAEYEKTQVEVTRLRLIIEKMKRMLFGSKRERFEADRHTGQLNLSLEN
jgi:N-dimethylarginine dimethylaminohydrolase